jgi:ATP-dependent DNA helicase RecG
VIGLSDPEIKAKQIRQYLFEQLSPKAPCSVSVMDVDGKPILLVDIPVGQEHPYVFADQIYIRQDAQSRHAQAAEIISLIKQRASRPITWERHAAPGAELSELDKNLILETAAMAARRGLKLENPSDPMEVLRQINLAGAGYILNSAIVLFGKAPHQRFPQTRIRAAVFPTDKTGDFLDRRDFEGNLFVLLDSVETFLRTHVPVAATFSPGQMRREDKPAYPFGALREGLLNALMHRDYAAFTGGVAVNIFPDRLEIWNSGKLPEGLSIADLKKEHPSLPTNPDIAQVVYLRELIEKVGRGTEKIIAECRAAGLPAPTWKQSPVGITLTFPRHRATILGAELVLNERQRVLIQSLKPGERITPAAYLAKVAAQVQERQARTDLIVLSHAGYLQTLGRGRSTSYRRTEKPLP